MYLYFLLFSMYTKTIQLKPSISRKTIGELFPYRKGVLVFVGEDSTEEWRNDLQEDRISARLSSREYTNSQELFSDILSEHV